MWTRTQTLLPTCRKHTTIQGCAWQYRYNGTRDRTAMVSLCHCDGLIVPLRWSRATAMVSLCHCDGLVVPLQWSHCATAMFSLCHCDGLIVPLRCSHCATAMVSCHCDVLIVPLRWSHCATLLHPTARSKDKSATDNIWSCSLIPAWQLVQKYTSFSTRPQPTARNVIELMKWLTLITETVRVHLRVTNWLCIIRVHRSV